MRKLPSLSELEHITSEEFGANMDVILDRVTDEDTALIIDHKGKSYVLCPAEWVEFPDTEKLEPMLINAVRYAATVDATNLKETVNVVKELLPALSKGCITELLEIIKDLDEPWDELSLMLEAALPTTEKEEDSKTL